MAVAGLSIWSYVTSTGPTDSLPSSEILTTTTPTPSEKSPGPVSESYTVPKDQPRVIRIPKLAVDAYVRPVGVDTANTMVAPDNIHIAGWYAGGVRPGEQGVSIINGHAGGRYEQGVFKRITTLQPGDSIRVQLGDRSWRDFTVVSGQSYTLSDSQRALFAHHNTADRELHLITCDGGFDDQHQTYDRRFVVVARRV